MRRAGFLQPDAYAASGTASNLGLSLDPLTRNSYAYVNGDPVNLYDPTGHGLRDWARKARDFVVGAAQQTAGVVKGFTEAAYETGKATAQLAWAGVALTGARGHDARMQTLNQAKTIFSAIAADPMAAGKAVVASIGAEYRNELRDGNYGEAIGRGLFAALSSLANGGILAKATGVDVIGGISRATDRVTRTAAAVRTRAGQVLDRARYGPNRDLSPERGSASLGGAGPSLGEELRTVEDVFANSDLLKGKLPGDVEPIVGRTPGWHVGTLRRGRHVGTGWTLRELNEAGSDFTDRYIQFHPGTRRHFDGAPYWKVSSGKLGIRKVEV